MKLYKSSTAEWFGRQIGACRSPIEQRFLVALLFMTDHSFDPIADRGHMIAFDGESGLELMTQVPVDNFRIDFVLATRYGRRFAVELDGFTYHGSTPEQFEYDSARQRLITERGYTVLRFSGREIDRDPVAAAKEALRHAVDATDRYEKAVKNRTESVAERRALLVLRLANESEEKRNSILEKYDELYGGADPKDWLRPYFNKPTRVLDEGWPAK
jgi:very-short-patch-repair endonuclease